jgi:hypothetical protein
MYYKNLNGLAQDMIVQIMNIRVHYMNIDRIFT